MTELEKIQRKIKECEWNYAPKGKRIEFEENYDCCISLWFMLLGFLIVLLLFYF